MIYYTDGSCYDNVHIYINYERTNQAANLRENSDTGDFYWYNKTITIVEEDDCYILYTGDVTNTVMKDTDLGFWLTESIRLYELHKERQNGLQ